MRLADIQPTAEELEAAKKILAGGSKVQRSKMQCMATWVKANLGENANVQASRGEQRQQYLQAYLVHMMRQKGSSSSSSNSRTVSHSKQDHEDVWWWSKFTMDKKMGPVKAESWRQVLKWRPDAVCGKDDEDHREYPVPRHWSRMTTEDLKAMQLTSTSDATAEDMDNLISVIMGDAEVKIKEEPKTPEEVEGCKGHDLLGECIGDAAQIPGHANRGEDDPAEGRRGEVLQHPFGGPPQACGQVVSHLQGLGWCGDRP